MAVQLIDFESKSDLLVKPECLHLKNVVLEYSDDIPD